MQRESDVLLRRIIEYLKKQNWTAILLEFVIVVIGVFVGLQAQEWSAEREDRQRLERIVTALKVDMEDARRVESGFQEDIQKGLATFDDARRQGELPLPFFYQIRGSDTAPKLIWGTLQQAGLGELLDPQLLFELSHFYSERDGIGVKVTRYMESIESDVLPYIEGDPAYFYDLTSGEMRPEYKATMDRLREWVRYSAALGPWSECLEKRLESASEPGTSCRSWSYYEPTFGRETTAIDTGRK
jgi:hypothetical protein